ncbi:esterase/lipase family protein [Marinicella litoralis]|uniref:Alpha/beta hydrolase family protein n=1 Tax=Marinicella litoralis TaxID=644220 RepID=A0A4R6XW90_9GAMM|nr:alpha/beta hydrolase [Marinicella litoralis]TDR22397.1 hypothetical protein C8D91_0885 [Marinicella litoralis]
MNQSSEITRSSQHLHRPSIFKMALEMRTFFEAGSFAFSYPLLQTTPKGDGHPVLVLPGFLASDFSTKLLRTFLKSRNYKPYGWKLGRNMGRHSDPITGCGPAIIQRLKDIHQKHGEKVTLIGWSLGGIYARELARQQPALVRQVVSMGSPFCNNQRANHATKIFEKTSGYKLTDMCPKLLKNMPTPPPVPSTSFYSKSDGITAWQCCVEQDSELTQNIEVVCSHLGYGHHPAVMWALADRLAQADGQWQPFKARLIEKLIYK